MEIVGALAAAGEDAEHRGAAGERASSDSSTSAADPSASTKPSRSRENGLEAFSGWSLLVDSAESSEKRISASAVAEPSAPIDSARSHSPRRIASTPSWMAVAPEAQAVDSVTGRPWLPKRSASRSAMQPNWADSKISGEVRRRPTAARRSAPSSSADCR